MIARVLGAGAGGGFPQWNCDCRLCSGQRRGTIAAEARTQASLAVSGDGAHWLLIGASPDVGTQIARTQALWPSGGGRHSPIEAVALPNGDVDAWAGLLSLRESTPLTLLATPTVRRELTEHNAVMRTLDRFPGHTSWVELADGQAVTLAGGVTVQAIHAPGKPPVHMMRQRGRGPDDNMGFLLHASGPRVAWFPSVAGPTPAVEAALRQADVIFFDGTFYTEDELIDAGLGRSRARDMGHWPVGGPEGSAAFLARLPARHKFLVHINNTNPLLDESSPERVALRAAGIELARDGQEWSG
jgi:pyrroloquinoline quinone biosynthesis protein B